MGESRGRARRGQGPDAGAQFVAGAVELDFRLFLEERRVAERARYWLAMLAITRLRQAHMMIDAMIEQGMRDGLALDTAVERALRAVAEPDVSWIREERNPPNLFL